MKDTLRTYNASGKIMYEEHFQNATKAYEAFKDCVATAERLPKGYETTVIRYDENGRIMNLNTVIGKGWK